MEFQNQIRTKMMMTIVPTLNSNMKPPRRKTCSGAKAPFLAGFNVAVETATHKSLPHWHRNLGIGVAPTYIALIPISQPQRWRRKVAATNPGVHDVVGTNDGVREIVGTRGRDRQVMRWSRAARRRV